MTDTPHFDTEFFETQFSSLIQASQDQADVVVPEDMEQPSGDVTSDLKAVTAKLNEVINAMHARSRAYDLDLQRGDGGLSEFVLALNGELARQGNAQGIGILIRQKPDGVLYIVETKRDDYPVPLPDENVVLLWCKAKYDWENTEAPEVPYVETNPCKNKDGEEVDDTRTVRLYLPPQGHGHPNVRTDEVLGYRVDENGDAICVTSYMDDRIGFAKFWTIGLYEPTDIPGGWALCDGTQGTIDMRYRVPAGYDPDTDGYTQNGMTGGYAIHGGDTNDHANHSIDSHSVGTTTVTVTGSTGAGGGHGHDDLTATGTYGHYGPYLWSLSGGTTAYFISDLDASHGHSITFSGTDGTHDHTSLSFSEGTPHDHTVGDHAAVAHSETDNRCPYRTVFFVQRVN